MLKKGTMMMAAALLAGVCTAQEKIYFEENFRNYNDVAPGTFSKPGEYPKGLDVGNDPIWAIMAEMNVRLGKDDAARNIYLQDIALPENLKDLDISFRFRLLNSTEPVAGKPEVKDKNGRVTQKAVEAKPGVSKSFQVMIGNTPVTFSSDKVEVAGQKGNYKFLPNWHWEYATIQIRNGRITIFVTRDRQPVKVLEGKFAGKLTSVNFKGLPENFFSLTDIMVSSPKAVTTFPASKHFADFRSLTQDMPKGAVKGNLAITPDATGYAGVKLRLNKVQQDKETPLKMILHWADGTESTHEIRAVGTSEYLMAPIGDAAKRSNLPLADAKIDIQKIASQYVRPLMKRYKSSYDCEPQYIDILREWNNLPAASKHVMTLEFRAQKDGLVDLYIDGSYIKKLNAPNKKEDAVKKLSKVEFIGNGVAEIVKIADPGKNLDSKYVVLDMDANPRAKTFVNAKSSLKEGRTTINGIPFQVAAPIDSADIGICKQGKGNWALEVEEYHGRATLDGFPSAVHFRLPAASYGYAHVILAIDPDKAKDKVLTTRLGHYAGHGSGGNMLGDTVMDLNDGNIPENFKKIGDVTLNGKKIPLYQVSIPLAGGKILDILARKEYVDFEFTGRGWENFEQLDNTMKPHPEYDSAFNIFAVTLEKLPVIMDIKQTSPGNVFTEDEKAQTTVTLKATENTKGEVVWTARDIDGNVVFTGKKAYDLKAGAATEAVIPLKAAVGFYELDITLVKDGRSMLSHPARFAILRKDRRTWDKETSPYATWWFDAHGSPGNMELGGPLMQKAGIRKCSWNFPTREAMEKYNITNTGNIGINTRNFDRTTMKFKSQKIKVPDPKNPKKTIEKELSGEEAFVADIRRQIDNIKSKGGIVDHALLWHESAPGYGVPEELLNMPLTEGAKKLKENDKWMAALINETGRLMKKHFPDIRLQIGNSSASVGAATRPMRAGADPKYYDSIGMETPAQVICPERLSEVGMQGMRITQDIAEKLSGKKVPLNGSWEFTYRCERDMGEQQQAEWYIRDVLISLANNFTLISPGIFFDCSNGYGNGLWGGSGIMQRGPYVYPKRAYVAYAALTNVLDNVKFVRQIDTGSTTVYAIELARKDGKTVTAMWAARGNVEFELIPQNGVIFNDKVLVTEMYGREYTLSGKTVKVKGGTSPVYVTTEKPLKAVGIAGRSFAKDEKRAAKSKVAYTFADPAQVTVTPDPQMTSSHTNFLPVLKPGTFTVAAAQDAEKGAALEVKLDLKNNQYKDSRYITEFTTIRLKEPALIPGNPAAIGLWVKGNSNWGQIRFEIEDAEGEIFKGLTTGKSWGCDIYDWPGNMAVNFDGWCMVSHPLRPTTLLNDHSPGPVSEQWVSCGGNKKIDLPVKLRAVTIGMNRWKLDLLDFKQSDPVILIRDCVGLEE